ncbi:MAG TPA: SMP-30/gluconolactonase/LRE family protein [Azospirillaceae bacterium]|nr:SMP-30/gluconolactonase/LRE family protein [Azospirillaceae bacterium]
MSLPSCVAATRCLLGEGPLWDPEAGRLYWFDIKGSRLHWLAPDREEVGTLELQARCSAAALTEGGLIVASDRGIGLLDPGRRKLDIRLELEPDLPGNRSNDGKADPWGNFWVGTMDDAEAQASGALYRVTPDWTAERVLEGLRIPNTLAWSPDGATMIFADSGEATLYAFDLAPASGRLSNRRVFAVGDGGTPDGSAMDEEGFLWNAQWGGARVVRYAPDGSIDRVVPLPVDNPTSCAFGGDDLGTLYVTSARVGLSERELARQPLAGGVFAFQPGVRGLPVGRFGRV